MPITIVAGKTADKYRSRLRAVESRLAFVEGMLVIPVIYRLVDAAVQKRRRSALSGLTGEHVEEGAFLFHDLQDLAERALWTAAQAGLAALTVEGASLRTVGVAALAACLSLLKNYVKQKRKIVEEWDKRKEAVEDAHST